MDMLCPRCGNGMRKSIQPASASATAIATTLDECERCGGLFIDGAELRSVSESLAKIPTLHEEIAARGTPGGGIAKCPRCGTQSIEFPFFEVRIDYCPACQGIFLDGNEREGLARTVDRDAGVEAPPVREGSYRTAAAAVRGKLVACPKCGKEVPAARTRISAVAGAVCDDCYALVEGSDEDAPLEDQIPTHAVSGFFGDVLSGVGTVLGVALLAGGHCGSCGCSHSSRCRH